VAEVVDVDAARAVAVVVSLVGLCHRCLKLSQSQLCRLLAVCHLSQCQLSVVALGQL